MTYTEFIQSIINTRGQWDIPEGEYFENHHITPRCWGGLPVNIKHNTKHENLIWLYPDEHYIAHKLLFEENPTDRGIGYAWFMLSKNFTIKDPVEYQTLREQYNKLNMENNTGSNNPNYMKPRSEETKKKISESRKGKYVGENSSMYGKRGILSPWYGKHHSEETKAKISESHKGEKNPMYGKPGTRLGDKNSLETNKKISEAQSIPVIDLTTGKEYYCMLEASKDLGCTCATISHHCKNGKPLKGHILIYKE